MMILAYRVDDPEDRTCESEVICVDCYDDGLGDDWYEGLRLTPITDPREIPEGSSGLAWECASPFCETQIKVNG